MAKTIMNKEPIITSVFRCGDTKTTRAQFTDKWIEMVNKIEKGKAILPHR